MNVEEGAKRMRRAGKWIVLIPLVVTVLLSVISFIAYAMNRNHGIIALAILLLPIEILGGILWLAGWIVEGFAKDAP
ncbi:MAG: hypothetical protein ABR990_09040 [Terracidiphilus sp.]|jgi:hypothetical protein